MALTSFKPLKLESDNCGRKIKKITQVLTEEEGSKNSWLLIYIENCGSILQYSYKRMSWNRQLFQEFWPLKFMAFKTD